MQNPAPKSKNPSLPPHFISPKSPAFISTRNSYVFEHLLRKFNEALNENPGEHFTPRDAIRLMVDLVLMLDKELAATEGVARTVYDCGCGTGGILSITKEHILQVNPQAKVFLYGQELNRRFTFQQALNSAVSGCFP